MSSPLVSRMRPFGTTVFAQMSDLARRTGALNLGQGFPDADGPPAVLEAAREAIAAGWNQYPPGRGHAVLREAVAEHQQRFHGLAVDPHREVLVTAGATEALAATLLALCEEGDEVVTFEPAYDAYTALIALAGAVQRGCVLTPPSLAVDEQVLRAVIGPRTKVVLLNTPHNPTGKVFTAAELDLIARLATEVGAWVVTDEVYEHLVYDDAVHVPMASRPGMRERTITIGSGGKTFSTTGWKIGWLVAPEELVSACQTVKQHLTFSGGAPFQPAIAAGLRLPDEEFARLRASLDDRRRLLVDGLRAAGFTTWLPQGTYFALADAAPLGFVDAARLCRELPGRCGVVGIPVSAFHSDPTQNASLVRFAFCKDTAVLTEAVERLQRLRQG